MPGPGHYVGIYRISPDSQWVVFSDDPLSSPDSVLHAVPTAGGSPMVFGLGTDALITPDSQRVIYPSPPDGDYSDLLSIQIFGGGLRNLSRMRNTDYAYGAQISPDGQATGWHGAPYSMSPRHCLIACHKSHSAYNGLHATRGNPGTGIQPWLSISLLTNNSVIAFIPLLPNMTWVIRNSTW